ncbi:MAG: trigger factor [Actinomycetota bacterium]|nr:trigger factor [Actinomycetota bacterium]
MKAEPLTTTSERLDKDRVKVRVEVDEAELDNAVEAVYRRWAREIKVPGFRKGKVPRQLIDARVGPNVVREEALRDALPDLYRRALEVEDLQAIAPPEIEVVEFESGSPLVFEATVDVRPEIDLPDFAEVEVEAPSAEVSDEDVNEQLERLRDRFAELETVGREAREGDHVLIDLKGYRHDVPIEGASAPDLLYEIGSGTGPPKLDEEVKGARPGSILKFTTEMPAGSGELAGEDVSFTVLVKEVKAKKLPQLNDDFARTVGEFDSLDELKSDLKQRLAGVKQELVEEQIRGLVLETLVGNSNFEAPEKLVGTEFQHRLDHLQEELKGAGLTLDDYARASQSTELEIRADLRSRAEKAVKAELLLEEIARREQVDVSREELGQEIAMAAAQAQRDPKELAEQLTESGRLGAVAADIMRRKALDNVVQKAQVKGRPAERKSEND